MKGRLPCSPLEHTVPAPRLTEPVPRRVPPQCRCGDGRAAPGAWAYGVQPTLRLCRRPALGEGGPDGEHLPGLWWEHSASTEVQERPNQETEQPPGSTPCPLSSNTLDLAKPPGGPFSVCKPETQRGAGLWSECRVSERGEVMWKVTPLPASTLPLPPASWPQEPGQGEVWTPDSRVCHVLGGVCRRPFG